jgi:Spy/CpxP family protein refolding chaperone
MKSTGLALLAAVALAMVSSAATAGPGGFGGPGMAEPRLMLEHMADHLDLDDIQRETVENIIEAVKPEFESLREQGRANREAIAALDPADPAYSTELNRVAVSNGELATQATLLMARVRTEVNAVLTDEQIAKLERSRERMQKRIKRRFSGQ